MKTLLACSMALALGACFFTGCSSGDSTASGQSSEDLSTGPSTNPPSTTPPTPQPVPPSPVPPIAVCPKGESICVVQTSTGACIDKCFPAGVPCAVTKCYVCEPPTPAPSAVCKWDRTACAWECPICDPPGPAPHPGCAWDLKTCTWDCPVCDPSGPPPQKQGCSWDTKACVWICL